MHEAALADAGPDRCRSCPINPAQAHSRDWTNRSEAEYHREAGHAARRRTGGTWPSSIGSVTAMLATGRAESAADILEKATRRSEHPGRCWTGWRPCGCTSASRRGRGRCGRKGLRGPDPAVAAARIGATYLAEGGLRSGAPGLPRGIQAKPDLFEACYSLAVLEQDAGDATASYELARKAVATAPNDRSREAAGRLADGVRAFASQPLASVPAADAQPRLATSP